MKPFIVHFVLYFYSYWRTCITVKYNKLLLMSSVYATCFSPEGLSLGTKIHNLIHRQIYMFWNLWDLTHFYKRLQSCSVEVYTFYVCLIYLLVIMYFSSCSHICSNCVDWFYLLDYTVSWCILCEREFYWNRQMFVISIINLKFFHYLEILEILYANIEHVYLLVGADDFCFYLFDHIYSRTCCKFYVFGCC
jgi:hypothetical protein